MMTQVLLKSDRTTYVAWIPSAFAILDKQIRLGSDPTQWRVVEIYASASDYEVKLMEIEADYWGGRDIPKSYINYDWYVLM